MHHKMHMCDLCKNSIHQERIWEGRRLCRGCLADLRRPWILWQVRIVYLLQQRGYLPKQQEYQLQQREYLPKQRAYHPKRREYLPKQREYLLYLSGLLRHLLSQIDLLYQPGYLQLKLLMHPGASLRHLFDFQRRYSLLLLRRVYCRFCRCRLKRDSQTAPAKQV